MIQFSRLQVESQIDSKIGFQILELEKPEPPDFETGTSENTRILRVFLRIVRTCHPITCTRDLFLFSNVIHRYSLVFLALPVPSPSLTSPPPSLSPKPQDLPFQVDSKAKGTSIGVGNHLLQVFHLGAVSFSSFSCKGSFLKVPKLGLSGLIVLGCVKGFPMGQSSSYESLY